MYDSKANDIVGKIEQLTSEGAIDLHKLYVTEKITELIDRLTTLEQRVSELEQKLNTLHVI